MVVEARAEAPRLPEPSLSAVQFRRGVVSNSIGPNPNAKDGSDMTVSDAVARYYEAWQRKQGDLSDVPLAEDFEFVGPVANFDSADGYRAMAREAGRAVTSFEVRRQFVDGNTVCSIINWEMSIPGTGRMTSAELLEVADGVIVRGELIYDAELLRRAMGQSAA